MPAIRFLNSGWPDLDAYLVRAFRQRPRRARIASSGFMKHLPKWERQNLLRTLSSWRTASLNLEGNSVECCRRAKSERLIVPLLVLFVLLVLLGMKTYRATAPKSDLTCAVCARARSCGTPGMMTLAPATASAKIPGSSSGCSSHHRDLPRVTGCFSPPLPRTGRGIPFRHACVRARRSLPDRLRSRARPRADS